MAFSLKVFASDWEEEFELWREFILGVKAIGEIYSADTAISVDLHSECLNIVCAIGPAGEIRQVKLNLIPAFIQSHGHCADEGFHSGRALIVARSESAADVFVI